MPWTLVSGSDGQPKVILTEPTGSSVEVLLYGGQVVSWKNDRREELLFMSTKATMKASKAIRGGIPISFPQFGSLGILEQHGSARNRQWELDGSPSPLSPPRSQSSVDLILKSTDEDLKTWPRSFELRVRIILTPGKPPPKAIADWFPNAIIPFVVPVMLDCAIVGARSLQFSFPLLFCHPHRRAPCVLPSCVPWNRELARRVLPFLFYFAGTSTSRKQVDFKVDRVYLSTPTKIAIIDHEKKRTLVLRKEGLPDAVLWNPWDKKAKALPDFGDEDYKVMLCVDSAVAEAPIVLKPYEEWRGRQELSIVSSSYCSGQLDPRKVLFG